MRKIEKFEDIEAWQGTQRVGYQLIGKLVYW